MHTRLLRACLFAAIAALFATGLTACHPGPHAYRNMWLTDADIYNLPKNTAYDEVKAYGRRRLYRYTVHCQPEPSRTQRVDLR